MFRVVMIPAETKLSGLGSIPDITDTPNPCSWRERERERERERGRERERERERERGRGRERGREKERERFIFSSQFEKESSPLLLKHLCRWDVWL